MINSDNTNDEQVDDDNLKLLAICRLHKQIDFTSLI